jgi:hypothetical protein
LLLALADDGYWRGMKRYSMQTVPMEWAAMSLASMLALGDEACRQRHGCLLLLEKWRWVKVRSSWMRIWKRKGVDLGARQRSCGALDVLEKASGHATELSASKLALLLHLGLARVYGVESEGDGVEHEELIDDGGGSVDEPLDDVAALVEVVL